jgi:hypothetical protein
MAKNRFGLPRDIPKDVRKRVRRRCGFGCVVCGSVIVTYEHFDPPFCDARTHRAEGITLLCGSHQLESSKGLLSPDSIRSANAKPRCLQRGYAAHVLDLGDQRPKLLVGGSDVTDCGSGLAFNDRWVLRVQEPEAHSRRCRLSAKFFSDGGDVICEIRNNELIVPAEPFEIEQTARTLLVRQAQDVVLELELLPPATLAVNRYIVPTAFGLIFVGRRRISDLLSSTEAVKSVIEFRARSGGRQTFVDCAFKADVGLNLCMTETALVMRNQAVGQSRHM